MWTLPLPSIEEVDGHLTAALTYASGQPVYPLSDAERGALHAVYGVYDALLGQPGRGLPSGDLDGCRESMARAYDEVQVGGRLARLRSSLLGAARECPYCGFGEPTQLDHYLPISTYGELAVYPRNLIPSCGPCNNAKRTVVPGERGTGFIHAYFQTLPDVTFLAADVNFENGALDVIYSIAPGMVEPGLNDRLDFTLRRLKLNDRYPRQINKFLSEQRAAVLLVRDHRVEGLTVSRYLELNAVSLTTTFGRNDWRTVLMAALARNDAFCAEANEYLGERG